MQRPSYHFTPPTNWMNDPNGLVYYAGEYHLFYQHHPNSLVWGPMHWGHAVSRDLVNWQHLPVALFPDEQGMIFSGSAVVDWRNTALFGPESLVALFTHHTTESESQSLAYSLDNGRTWQKYPNNPVLQAPEAVRDFRDPKVFWYGGDEGHWVMCLAAGDTILFYSSSNLIEWQPCGSFGAGYGAAGGVWETPDLFPLQVDNGPETLWVLTVGILSGSPAGGSGTHYYFGQFDGRTFTSQNPPDTRLWADFGPDYYAPQSWSGEPNGRRLMIGWLSNWQYAQVTPAVTWRGMFSLPRELALTQTEQGIRLRQRPLPALATLRSQHHHWQDETIQPGVNLLDALSGDCLEIVAECAITAETGCFGFHVRMGENEQTIIRYDAQQKKLFLDRSRSGQTDFHDRFAHVYTADMPPIHDTIRLQIFVDRYSVEVFGNDGLVVLSAIIFPSEQSRGLALMTESAPVRFIALDVYHLNIAGFAL